MFLSNDGRGSSAGVGFGFASVVSPSGLISIPGGSLTLNFWPLSVFKNSRLRLSGSCCGIGRW